MFQYLQYRKKSGGTLGPGSFWISNIRTDIQKEIQRRCIDTLIKENNLQSLLYPWKKFVVQVVKC